METMEKQVKSNVGSNKQEILLLDWMRHYMERQREKGRKDIDQISYTIKLLVWYKGDDVTLGEVDRDFCAGFIHYLTNVYVTPKYNRFLKKVTAKNYCNCLEKALNSAVRAEIIMYNPFRRIDSADKIKVRESPREFLTIDELKILIRTPCKVDAVKKAYLFLCYCGLRISDMEALMWQNVVWDRNHCHIEVIMQKTGIPLYLPLSVQALRWMPARQENQSPSDRIFNLPSQAYGNRILKSWAASAGIVKKITWHTARHTFATMMLTLGADLYTTSRLLGHSEVSTTQIYARIVDKKKDEAVNLVNDVFADTED